MRRALLTVAGVAVVCAGVIAGQGKTDPTLDKLAREFEAAFNAQDPKKVAALYTEDAVAMPATGRW